MLEHHVDDLIGRGHEKILMVNFRIIVGDSNHGFSIAYYPKSNYVKVFHKKNEEVFEDFSDNVWNRISDHDSCWRDCWYFASDIIKKIEANWESHHSFYMTIEKMKLFDVVKYETPGFSDDERKFKIEVENEYSKNGNVSIIQVGG
jgi:hypothetical protein